MGTKVNVWPDAWLSLDNCRDIQTPIILRQDTLMVRDLLGHDGSVWDESKIFTIFQHSDVLAILSIPISSRRVDDELIWHYKNNGIYDVKSGYHVAVEADEDLISKVAAALWAIWNQRKGRDDVGDLSHGEEVAVASGVEEESERELGSSGDRRGKKRKSGSRSNVEDGNEQEKESGVRKVALDVDDDEDAICKRTRARYSLASFTLDELETFLQESDDEDDLPNVDDESNQEISENVDDEDEDNDVDFEIELEELLDSDVDDGARDEGQGLKYERGGRRPETRQKKHQKASAQYKKKLLRPLLPVFPNGFPSPFPALLVHVFSLYILDSSRQHLASLVQGLIFEMLHKRDDVIACKSIPYPALFPHKPSPAAVANRVLFPDSEDELLALGIMEYNTDCKVIQQRFLPCKSKHQVFVRQKNHCSSKAPENPIKAVQRMKTSLLTAEETERFQEGLRVYKLDLLSLWKFDVLHRDPSLLPRQLRIALGTQKSYKQDAARKEKRRISEAKKRSKTADLANWKPASDKECNVLPNVIKFFGRVQDNQADRTGGGNSSGDDCVDNSNKAYVHQAFLSLETRPGEAQLWSDNMNGCPYGSSSNQYSLTQIKPSPPNTILPNYQISNMSLSTSKSQIHLRPYRSPKTDSVHIVRLAPDLTPVNLPRSWTGDAGKENIASQFPHAGNLRTSSSVDTRRDKSNQAANNVTDSHPEESAVVHNACIAEERGTDSNLQMHPLLFQASESGRLSYLPLSCNIGASSSFSFFSGHQPQLNLSLFHYHHQANHVVDGFNKSLTSKDSTSASCSIDFHPLLQRTDEENSNLVMALSNPNQFVCLRGEFTQSQSHFDAVQNKSFVNHGPVVVDPKQSSSNEKANDLDLEIHLSSNSAKETSEGGKDNEPWSTQSELKSGRRIETCKVNSPRDQHNEHCPTVHSNFVSGADASPVPSNNVSICNMDNLDLEIQVLILQRRHLREWGYNYVSLLTDVAVWGFVLCSLLKSSLTSLGKETTSSSWLSLDSHAPVDSPKMKAVRGKGEINECQAAKKLSSCCPNRLCKKTTLGAKGETQKDVCDMAQQLCLGPLAFSTLRKPRKHTCRTNTNLGTQTAAENGGTNTNSGTGTATENDRCDQDKLS
ncbi:hypothetical protein Peur_053730 [Populus x canadensis]